MYKKFERYKEHKIYKNGDYVMLSDSDAWNRNYALIKECLNDSCFIQVFFPDLDKHIYYLEIEGEYYKWLHKNFIERKMTKNEKEDLIILLDVKKYNI